MAIYWLTDGQVKASNSLPYVWVGTFPVQSQVLRDKERILLYHSHPISASLVDWVLQRSNSMGGWRDRYVMRLRSRGIEFDDVHAFLALEIDTTEPFWMQMTWMKFRRGLLLSLWTKERTSSMQHWGDSGPWGGNQAHAIPHHLWSPEWEGRRARPDRAMFSEWKGLALLLQGSQYLIWIQGKTETTRVYAIILIVFLFMMGHMSQWTPCNGRQMTGWTDSLPSAALDTLGWKMDLLSAGRASGYFLRGIALRWNHDAKME